MKIGIVGGTGDIGEGMALRLSPIFDVVVGSREKDKAEATCRLGKETLKSQGKTCSLTGVSNQDAVDSADIVILAIPFKHLAMTLEGLHGFEDKIVISPVNPMEKRDHFMFVPPPEGSAALMIKRLLPPTARICSGFNTIAANKCDDEVAKREVMGIVNRISRLQAFDAGPLAASSMVEALTPLLLNIARYNKMRDVGIQFR